MVVVVVVKLTIRVRMALDTMYLEKAAERTESGAKSARWFLKGYVERASHRFQNLKTYLGPQGRNKLKFTINLKRFEG